LAVTEETTIGSASSSTPSASAAAQRLRAFAVVVAALAILIAAGPFVLETYMVNILIRAFHYALAALTVDILWGYTGILTFGQAAFFGIGAYAAALVFTHIGFSPTTIALAVALALAVPALVGLLVGWLSFYPGSTPLYASVVSLAFPIVVTQIIFSGGTFTGSSSGVRCLWWRTGSGAAPRDTDACERSAVAGSGHGGGDEASRLRCYGHAVL
jgi:branched-chain amino acid transport system permease protein